jgi:uncharacterized membrane protein YvbJ
MLTSLNNEENQLIIFCPYCLTQVEESVKLCPTCGEDATRDALVGMTLEEYINRERVNCDVCGNLKLKLAPLCAVCHTWQNR